MSRIENPSLEWRDGDVPFSTGFDDVYYNLKDGLSETKTVFLDGNGLPQAWQDQTQFTIAETGFGTGLNFLAAWQMFEKTAPQCARLDFISVEHFPLRKDDLQRALQPWRGRIEDRYIDRLLAAYPPRIPGFHRRWLNDRMTLTVIFDDAVRGFSQLEAQVDAWFLDGFSPAKNPQLWQEDLFHHMARLSHNGTTLSSFTAVGDVRRGLNAAGFKIKRLPGYGYKYHRITGVFQSDKIKRDIISPKHIDIVGAGFAGLALSNALRRRGVTTTVYEQADNLSQGASGNRIGLINPKIEAQDNPRNDAGLAAFSFIQHVLSDLPDIDYRQTGALHLATPDKSERLHNIIAKHDWLQPHMQWIEQNQTKQLCGLDLPHDGFFYADAGMVDNRKLLSTLSQQADIVFDTNKTESTKPIVFCNGWNLHQIAPELSLQPVRGQVTFIDAPTNDLKCPVMFGSYVAPIGKTWAIGATFQQNNEDPAPDTQSDEQNVQSLTKVLSYDCLNVIGQWAGIRTASRDRFPIVGALQNRENAYVLGALGSHGIQFSFLLAEILACELTGAPMPIGRDALETVLSRRFWK